MNNESSNLIIIRNLVVSEVGILQRAKKLDSLYMTKSRGLKFSLLACVDTEIGHGKNKEKVNQTD